jgi:hypothetical protein
MVPVASVREMKLPKTVAAYAFTPEATLTSTVKLLFTTGSGGRTKRVTLSSAVHPAVST